MHALAEFGQLRGGSFAAKQIAAEFCLELLDRPRQRWLGDVALVGGAREVEHTRDSQEVANLMHLHGRTPDRIIEPNYPISRRKDTRTAIAPAYGFGSERAFPY